MTLRRSFLALLMMMIAPAALAGGSLVLITSYLHRAALSIEASVESIRAVEEMQVALLEHDRARDGISRSSAEGTVRRHLRTAERFAVTDDERALIADVREVLQDYFAASRTSSSPKEKERTLALAYDSLERLVNVNVEQARLSVRSAARWDRIANAVGIIVAAQLALMTLVAIGWLRSRLIRPVVSLAETIEKYSTGEKEFNAPIAGPAEIQRIGQELNELAKRLRAQQEKQLTFLAAIAHDLRNPLAALRFSAESFAATARPENAKKMVMFRRQIDRMERLVSDLQDASHIEAGRFDLRMDSCDLRELAEDARALFESAGSGHSLEVEAPPGPVVVRGDHARLSQVVNNLVSNAIKYSPRGGRVLLRVDALAAEGVLFVSDEGIGIAPEDQKHLFEPFQRGATRHPEIPGVGLGLSVAKRIVEAHAGTLSVESRPGATTFRVAIPLAAAADRVPRLDA